jgi:hypothetical protein
MTGNGQKTITFRYLSGAYIDSSLNVSGPVTIPNNLVVNYLSALSGAKFVNTTFTTTSTLSVNAVMNVGPALFVGSNGTGDLGSFYDTDAGVEMLHIGGINGANPNIGIRVSNPTKTLTVSGDLSASGSFWLDGILYLNNQSLTALFANKQITDATTSVVSSASSRWATAYDLITGGASFGTLSAASGYLITTSLTSKMISAERLSALDIIVFDSLSAPILSGGVLYGDGSKLSNINTNQGQMAYSLLTGGNAVGNLTAANGYYITTSLSSLMISANTVSARNVVVFNSLSAPVLCSAGFIYGDASRLTNLVINQGQMAYSLLTGGTSVGNLTAAAGYYITTSLSSFVVSANTVSAVNIVAFNTISAPIIRAGTLFGDGSNITNIAASNPNGQMAYSLLTGGNAVGNLTAANGYYITTSLSSLMISANTVSARNVIVFNSLSAPVLCSAGFIYGDASRLTNLIINQGQMAYSLLTGGTSVGNLTAAAGYYITTSLSSFVLSADTITARNIVAFNSLSAPILSGGVLYGDGSKLTGIVAGASNPNGQMAYSLLTGGVAVGNLTAAGGYYITTSLSSVSISAQSISSDTGTFYKTVSTVSVSANVITSDAYKITSSNINNQTSNYTILPSDNGKIITVNAATTVTVSIPTGLPVGFSCMVTRLGVGLVSLAAVTPATTTINSLNGYKSVSDQYGSITVLCYASESIILNGNLGYP